MPSSSLPGAECVGVIIDEKFSLLEWLGGTPHSSVFRTQLHMDPPREAILKLIPEGAVNAEALTAQWETARTLTHPNLVQLFHSGRCELDGRSYYFAVTEYADELLSETVPSRALTQNEVKDMLEPVLDALTYLHIRHLAHASLKPSNIMVVSNTLKLSIDSVHREEDPPSMPRKTRSGANTPEASIYHAPELGTEAPTRAADMWSLGVLLAESLTQKLPTFYSSKATNPMVPEGVPEPYLRIARDCLRVDPSLRYALGDIHNALHPAPPTSAPARPTAPPISPSQAKRRYALYVIVAVALAAVAGGIMAIVSMGSRHPAPQSAAPTPAQELATPSPQPSQPLTAQQQSAPSESAAPQPHPAQQTPSQRPTQPESPPAQTAALPSSSVAVVHQVLPDASQNALQTIRGHIHVAIRAEVDNTGNVTGASIAEPGPSHYFANLALEASRKWTFQPSPGTWLLHYTFAQTGVEASAEPAAQ
jgi:TonB family protein